MTPYFVKYGYSRRFHDAFEAAQAEARTAGRGIWDPGRQHYPDYDERFVWWKERADFIAAFDADAAVGAGFVGLTREDALTRLGERVGLPVTVLGTVASVRKVPGGPTLVLLGVGRDGGVPLVFFEADVLRQTGLEAVGDGLVRAQGTVSLYHSKSRNEDQLQMVVGSAEQVRTTPP